MSDAYPRFIIPRFPVGTWLTAGTQHWLVIAHEKATTPDGSTNYMMYTLKNAHDARVHTVQPALLEGLYQTHGVITPLIHGPETPCHAE